MFIEITVGKAKSFRKFPSGYYFLIENRNLSFIHLLNILVLGFFNKWRFVMRFEFAIGADAMDNTNENK